MSSYITYVHFQYHGPLHLKTISMFLLYEEHWYNVKVCDIQYPMNRESPSLTVTGILENTCTIIVMNWRNDLSNGTLIFLQRIAATLVGEVRYYLSHLTLTRRCLILSYTLWDPAEIHSSTLLSNMAFHKVYS